MKIWQTASFFSLTFLLLLACCADAQITVTSVNVSISASTIGNDEFPAGMGHLFADDYDMLSLDEFTDMVAVSAFSGYSLNSSYASAHAGATFDGSTFLTNTYVEADGFYDPSLSPHAAAMVVIEFHLDSSYTLDVSRFESAEPYFGGWGSIAENSLYCTNGFAHDYLSGLSGQSVTIGPGDYRLSSGADASFESNLFSETQTSVTFTATTEPTLLMGDLNQDTNVNFLDIAPFISSLSVGEYLAEADMNEDGLVSFLDIGPFIQQLLTFCNP